MDIERTSIEGVLIVKPSIFRDRRGYFLETYQVNRYRDSGISASFVQDNLSYSVRHTLRGLHFQRSRPQAKLVQVLQGEVFDVAVDIRIGSATFGRWTGARLSEKNGWQIYIPEGFAHGFCVLSSSALFTYKCSDFYVPEDEGGILWSDPDLGVRWPVQAPVVSEKDSRYPRLRDLGAKDLPKAGQGS